MPKYRPVATGQSFVKLEEGILERWRERDIFEESLRRREGAPRWVFYEGPPTANGRPGSHHVLSRVFKDVFPRYRTMRGFRVDRKAGWDCHGLPVELQIERELGLKNKHEIEAYGVEKFNKRCRESVLEYIDEWNTFTERIAFWVDQDDAYYTLDNTYIESVWWSLKQVFDKGLLYQGYKVVPYCPRCGTALSSHEVALGYKDVYDPSVYVRFPVKGEEGVSLLAWTTTPWTLLSNAALAVDPDVTYARVRANGEELILAEALVEKVVGEGAEIVATMPGRDLAGTAYDPPFHYINDFGPRGHTVLEGDFVTTEDGTGIVHTSISFGEDDFRLGEQYGIPVINPVKLDGTFDERIEDFAGRFVKEADPDIVKALDENGRLFRAEQYYHSYPHCWRCDTPLLYYAKQSWYVRTTDYRDELLANNASIDWHPEHIRDGRMGDWLRGNVDWALSRERYWGTPLPIWQCEGESKHLTAIGSVADIRAHGGEPPDDLHKPYIDDVVFKCPHCDSDARRVPEVIDVWWDSGCMPFAQWHAPHENEEQFQTHFPAQYICEALDQTRGWFYSLLAISTMLFGKSSYETCLCLGLMVDEEGQKMSKSRGNIVPPWDVLNTHGADAFRWYFFTSKQPWDGYRFSMNTVGESVRQFMLTLWNTYAFYVLYANLTEPEEREQTDMDRWIRSRLAATVETATERMEAYDTTAAGRAVGDFVDDLSNWYVRASRKRFYGPDGAAFSTLHECLLTVSKLIAPLTPFIADEIYDNIDGSEPSVHLCDWPAAGERDTELEWQFEVAREAVELGRKARAEGKLGLRQPLREAVIVAGDRERAAIEHFSSLVRDELNVKELRFVGEADELGRWELKPNYRALGPRFGKRMPKVAEAVAGLDAQTAASIIRGGGTVGIAVDGEEHGLALDDVQMVLQPLEGYQVERAGTHAVALNLELDDELVREGLAREIVRAIQNARKEAGLNVEDRILLDLSGADILVDAAREHQDYIAGEVLAIEVSFNGAAGGVTAEIRGHELRMRIERTEQR